MTDDFEQRVRALEAAPGMTADELEQVKESILLLAKAQPAPVANMADLSTVLRPTGPTCHHCGTPATHQWQRAATPDEAEQHWAALEQNIRASNSGRPDVDYTHPRNDEVRKAVFGCDNHRLNPTPADNTPEAIAAAIQTGAERRAILHAADCAGHGACQCGEEGADA